MNPSASLRVKTPDKKCGIEPFDWLRVKSPDKSGDLRRFYAFNIG